MVGVEFPRGARFALLALAALATSGCFSSNPATDAGPTSGSDPPTSTGAGPETDTSIPPVPPCDPDFVGVWRGWANIDVRYQFPPDPSIWRETELQLDFGFTLECATEGAPGHEVTGIHIEDYNYEPANHDCTSGCPMPYFGFYEQSVQADFYAPAEGAWNRITLSRTASETHFQLACDLSDWGAQLWAVLHLRFQPNEADWDELSFHAVRTGESAATGTNDDGKTYFRDWYERRQDREDENPDHEPQVLGGETKVWRVSDLD